MERDADFAVGLEATDTRAVSGARIDDDKGRLLRSTSTPAGGTTLASHN